MSSPAELNYEAYYHIHNRGINRCDIFIEERNYTYFLKLYARHIPPVAETFAYCLLKNHFHLLVRIRSDTDIHVTGTSKHPITPSQALSNLFNAYAKAINKAYNRTGSLFQHPFGRKCITSNRYLQNLIVYIHQNPMKHGFVDNFRDWPYSSYQHLNNRTTEYLAHNTITEIFGNSHTYHEAHISVHNFTRRNME